MSSNIPPRPGSGAARRQAAAKKKAQKGPRNPLVIVGAVVAVVVLALVIALVAGGGDSDEASGDGSGEDTSGLQETRPVTIAGEALPPFQETEGDAAIGLAPPEVSGASFNGVEMSVPVAGKPTLIVVLAHWCPHCQAEVPVLTQWDAEGRVPAGLEVFGIATSTDSSRPNYPPSVWLEEEGFPFAVMADSEDYEAAQALGVTGYPAFIMVDAAGKVAWRTSGEVPIEQLEALLAKTLASSPA